MMFIRDCIRIFSRSKFARLREQICDDDKRYNTTLFAAERRTKRAGTELALWHNTFYLVRGLNTSVTI